MAARLTPAALAALKPAAFDGSVYRIVHERHRDQILSTEGNRKARGRYHLLGEAGVLYTSADPETAREEVKAKAAWELLAPEFVMGEVRLRLHRLLDLTDAVNLKEIGVSKEALTSSDYSLTQAISSAARQAGFEGLKVPSTAGKGENIIVFGNNIGEGSLIGVQEIRPGGL